MFPAQLFLGGESRQFREFQVVQGSVILVGSRGRRAWRKYQGILSCMAHQRRRCKGMLRVEVEMSYFLAVGNAKGC